MLDFINYFRPTDRQADRQTDRQTDRQEMFVFQKFGVLCFLVNTRFEISPFTLLPTNYAKVFVLKALQFISLIFFLYQKPTLILLLVLITIWKFLGTP